MNNSSSKYLYTIQDKIDGLVVNYQGYKSWPRVFIYLVSWLFACFAYLLIFESLLSYALKHADPLFYIIPSIIIITFILGTYQTLLATLDALFDHEEIIIGDSCIHIYKSGFLSFEINKTVSKIENIWFFTALNGFENSISFSRSKVLSHLQHRGTFKGFYSNPKRSFCKGISYTDAISIMGKIKIKSPNMNLIVRDDIFIDWDLRDKKL